MHSERTPGIIGMEKYRKYAVVLPLVKKNGEWHLLFEVRASGLRRQPGEICFPGGGVESGEDYASAAKRECCEELMIAPECVEMIRQLDVFISPYDLMVFPYLAVLHDYQGSFSSAEVDEVFEVPISWFETHPEKVYKNRIYTELSEDFPYDKIPGGRDYPWGHGSYETIFYFWEDHTIWGLTAAILRGSLGLIHSAIKLIGADQEHDR